MNSDMLMLGPGGWNATSEKGKSTCCMAAALPKGSTMKRYSLSPRPLPSVSPRPQSRGVCPRPSSGFTLVEMLVVVAIIGMLAALVTSASIVALRAAKRATVVMEIKQLEMACQMYKEKFGEYPPDFADVATADGQAVILRHLAKAFPRYQPGITGTATGWAGVKADVKAGWNFDLDVVAISPGGALTFWLGGQPDWRLRDVADADGAVGTPILPGQTAFDLTKPIKGFLGFSANPANPFESYSTTPSRIKPFFDFDPTCTKYYAGTGGGGGTAGGIAVWPAKACNMSQDSPIVYFRAENGTYFTGTLTTPKSCSRVRPAVDIRMGGTTTWINPQSIQIFSSGLDCAYGTLSGTTTDRLLFPSGANYAPQTYDDITNFSNGTLEDARP
jgi:prepilin-type N-terminal cleavage/methylation domain-containing protein